MKRTLLSATAIALALSIGSAFAADLPSRKEAPVYIPPPPLLTWTGFYAGVNLGGGWQSNVGDYDSTYYILSGGAVSAANNSGGVVGGGQIGYNYQFGSFLVGAEADFQGTSIGFHRSNFFLGGNGIGVNLPWFGTVRGRAGYLITPTLLVYGTAGFAYGEVQGNWTGFTNTRTGWTAGGGVEWMFAPNWSAKAEYLFADLDSGGRTTFTGYQWGYHYHPQINTVRAGLNYHFNWGAAPVVAKY